MINSNLFRYKKAPTFSEFVDFLLSSEVETYNEHWLPYYLLCTPCHLNYTVIAKTEDIEDDSRSKTIFSIDIDSHPHTNYVLPT